MSRWILYFFGALAAGALIFKTMMLDSIVFQSAESRTVQDGPVFNQIRHFSEGKFDIWMMNQSHHGRPATADQWDRLAIIVDSRARTARFLQIEPGPLEWSWNLVHRQVPYRASCFMCHSNGLRAIRPESGTAGWREQFTTLIWNLKIKNYGRVSADPLHALEDNQKEIPFRHRSSLDNEKLKTPICISCHRDLGLFARGTLTRQNSITIQYMVESGNMPPFGISLTEQEKQEIKNFTLGI